MNLSEIRSAVKNILNYQPELQAYNNNIDTLINAAYQYIWTIRAWTFAQKIDYLNVYRDLLPTDHNGAGGGQFASVTDMSRQVNFTGNYRELQFEPYNWEGQIFECQGRDYVILQVINSDEIRLAEPFRGITNASETDFKLKHRYYTLPQDLIDLHSVSHRDTPAVSSTAQGKIIAISNRREEEFNLKQDDSSNYADSYIPIPPAIIPPGEDLSIAVTFSPDGNPAVGNFPDNYYMEFCWAFETEGGLLGPLSKPQTKSTGTHGQGTISNSAYYTVSFLSHDGIAIDTPTYDPQYDTYKNPWEGLRKRIFFNQNFNHTTGKRLGLPLWREVTRIDSSTGAASQFEHEPLRAQDEEATAKVGWLSQVSPGNKRYIEFDGHHQKIRPFPRINSVDFEYPYAPAAGGLPASYEQHFRQLEIRYTRKHLPLCSDTDTPEMPYELHHLIVYKALEDIYIKAGNLSLSDNYRRKIDKDIKAAERRYVGRSDSYHQRRTFEISSRVGAPWLDSNTLKHTP
jgi:hypothetical protein